MTRVLTIRQPWTDLIMAGEKDVENRTWPVPSTLLRCPECGGRGGRQGSVHWGDGPVPEELAYSPCPYCDDTPTDEWAAEHAWPVRIGIHAAMSIADSPDGWAAHTERGLSPHGFPLMALLGFVTVTGCHHADECARCACGADACQDEDHGTQLCSRWAEPDVWHWTLADPEPFEEPVTLKGKLGLWTLPAEEADR